MQKIYLILLLLPLLLIFSVQSFAQHTKPRLDRKIKRQLEKNDKYYMKLWVPWDSTQTTHLENWKWHGDEKPVYVDMLHCKDEKLFKYIKRKICNKQNNMTILDREYYFPIFRIDSINNELIICAHNNFVNVLDAIFDCFSYSVRSNSLKGICKIDGIYVFIHGNMVNQYFDVIENIPMPSPLPAHKTIYNRKYSDERGLKSKDFIYKNGYATYKNGRIRNHNHKKGNVSINNDTQYLEYIQNAPTNNNSDGYTMKIDKKREYLEEWKNKYLQERKNRDLEERKNKHLKGQKK